MVGSAEPQRTVDSQHGVWRWDRRWAAPREIDVPPLKKRETAHLLVEECPLRMWDCAYEYLICAF